MPKIKYYERVKELSSIDLDSSLPLFDIERLRAKGFLSNAIGDLLRAPLWLLKVLRKVCPTPRIGRFVLVTRADDVREVLTNTKVFSVPFGTEMRVVSGGGDFVLGTNDGAIYRAQKKHILKAFPPQDMAQIINKITEDQAQKSILRVSANIDPISDLAKPCALAVL